MGTDTILYALRNTAQSEGCYMRPAHTNTTSLLPYKPLTSQRLSRHTYGLLTLRNLPRSRIHPIPQHPLPLPLQLGAEGFATPEKIFFFSCSSSNMHDAMRLVLRATSGSANEIQSQITTSYTCGDGFGGHPPHWRAEAGYRVTNCDRTVSTECRLSGPRTAPSGVEGKGKREKKVGYQSAGGVPTWADIARGGGAGYTEPKARLPAEKGRSHKSNSDPILL
jgi:hypothetical protein